MAYTKKERSGILVYFDIIPALERLAETSKSDVCDIFIGALRYGKYGELPELEGAAGILFEIVRSAVDRDGETFRQKSLEGQWKAYCKKAKERGEAPLSFEEWMDADADRCTHMDADANQSKHMDADADKCIPSQHNTSQPTININSSCRASAEAHEKKCLKKVFDHESNPYKAARYLSEQICKRLTTIKPHPESTLQNWAADFDRCNRLDGHDWPEIERVLVFAQEDQFWQQNILSGQKFRSQYVQLLARMGGTQ